jgi:hypothetical protein
MKERSKLYRSSSPKKKMTLSKKLNQSLDKDEEMKSGEPNPH